MAEPIKVEVLLDLNKASEQRVVNQIRQGLNEVNKGKTKNDLSKNLIADAKAADKFSVSMKRAGESAKKSSSEIAKTDSLLANLSKRFISLAKFSLASFFVTQLTQPILQAAGAIIELDTNLNKLQQITGRSKQKVAELQSSVLSLGKAWGVNTQELSEANVILAQAGIALADVKKLTDLLAQTSLSPSFEDVGKTAETLIAIRDQFRIGDDFTRGARDFTNIINEVSKNFAVEAGNIAEAVRNTGSVFAQAEGLADGLTGGVTEAVDKFNEFVAVFSAVRSTTRLSSSVISSGLRTVFQRLQRDKTEADLREVLPDLNLRDESGKFIGVAESFAEISAQIEKANLSSTSAEVAKIVEAIGGLRQSKITSSLLFSGGLVDEIASVGREGVGKDSVSQDALARQETLAVKLAKIRKEIFGIFVKITDDKSFLQLIDLVGILTKSFTKLLDVLLTLAPLVAGSVLFKGAGLAASAAGIAPRLGGAAAAAGPTGAAFGFFRGAGLTKEQKRDLATPRRQTFIGAGGTSTASTPFFTPVSKEKQKERNQRKRAAQRRTRARLAAGRLGIGKFGGGRGGKALGIAAGATVVGGIIANQIGGSDVAGDIARGREPGTGARVLGRVGAVAAGAGTGALTGALAGSVFGAPGAAVGATIGAVTGGILAYIEDVDSIIQAELEKSKNDIKSILEKTADQSFANVQTLGNRRNELADRIAVSSNVVNKGREILSTSQANKAITSSVEELNEADKQLFAARSSKIRSAIKELNASGALNGLNATEDLPGALRKVSDFTNLSREEILRLADEVEELGIINLSGNLKGDLGKRFKNQTELELRQITAVGFGQNRKATGADLRQAQENARETVIGQLERELEQLEAAGAPARDRKRIEQQLKELNGELEDELIDRVAQAVAFIRSLPNLNIEAAAFNRRADTVNSNQTNQVNRAIANFSGQRFSAPAVTQGDLQGRTASELQSILNQQTTDLNDKAQKEVAASELIARGIDDLRSEGLATNEEDFLAQLDKFIRNSTGGLGDDTLIKTQISALLKAQASTSQGREELRAGIADGSLGQKIRDEANAAGQILEAQRKILTTRIENEAQFVAALETANLNVVTQVNLLVESISKSQEAIDGLFSTIKSFRERADEFLRNEDVRTQSANAGLGSVGVNVSDINSPADVVKAQRNLRASAAVNDGLDDESRGGDGRNNNVLNERARINVAQGLLGEQLEYLASTSGRFADALEIATEGVNFLAEANSKYLSVIDRILALENKGDRKAAAEDIASGLSIIDDLVKKGTSRLDFTDEDVARQVAAARQFASPQDQILIDQEIGADFRKTEAGQIIQEAIQKSSTARGFGQATGQVAVPQAGGGESIQSPTSQLADLRKFLTDEREKMLEARRLLLEESLAQQRQLQEEAKKYIEQSQSVADIFESSGLSMVFASDQMLEASNKFDQLRTEGLSMTVEVSGADEVSQQTIDDAVNSIVTAVEKAVKVRVKPPGTA